MHRRFVRGPASGRRSGTVSPRVAGRAKITYLSHGTFVGGGAMSIAFKVGVVDAWNNGNEEMEKRTKFNGREN